LTTDSGEGWGGGAPTTQLAGAFPVLFFWQLVLTEEWDDNNNLNNTRPDNNNNDNTIPDNNNNVKTGT
jgi:hypothetical protein